MGDIIQNDGDKTPQRGINFTKSLLNNSTLADIYKTEYTKGFKPMLMSREEIEIEFPSFVEHPEELDSFLKYQDQEYINYQEGNFDPYDTKEYTFPDTEYNRRFFKLMDIPKPLSEAHIEKSSDMFMAYPGLGEIQVLTPDQSASSKEIFTTKEGEVKSLKSYDNDNYNDLKWVMDDDGLGTNWQEAGDDEVVSSNLIKTYKDRTIESNNIFESMYRGLWSGTVPLMAKGLGSIVGVVGDLTDELIAGDWNYDDPDTWTDEFEKDMTNWGNRHTHQNMDEQLSVFDDWSSFWFNVSNGVGQMSSLIAMTAATGGSNIGIQAGLVLMSGEAMSGFREQMRDMGVSDATSAKWSVLFGAASYATEQFATRYILKNMGGKIAQRIHLSGRARTKGNVINLVKEEVKGLEIATGIAFKDASKKTQGKVISNIINKFLKLRYKALTAMDKSVAANVAGGAILEGIEEEIEAVAHSIISTWFNGAQQNIAEKCIDTYGNGNIKFTRNPNNLISDKESGKIIGELNLPYTMTGKDGRSKQITQLEYDAIQKDLEYARKVVKGDVKLDTSIGIEEGFVAMVSTAITLGLGNIGRLHKTMKTDRMAFQQALLEVKNPRLEAERRKTIDALKKKHLGKDYIDKDGDIIKGREGGISEAESNANAINETIDLYKEAIRNQVKEGKIADLMMSDNKGEYTSLIQEITKKKIEIDELQDKLKEEKLPDDKVKDIQKQLDQAIIQYDYLATPTKEKYTTNKGEIREVNKSRRYHELWNNISGNNYYLDDLVNAHLKNEGYDISSEKLSKLSPEQQEKEKLKHKRAADKYREKLIKKNPFVHGLGYIVHSGSSLSTFFKDVKTQHKRSINKVIYDRNKKAEEDKMEVSELEESLTDVNKRIKQLGGLKFDINKMAKDNFKQVKEMFKEESTSNLLGQISSIQSDISKIEKAISVTTKSDLGNRQKAITNAYNIMQKGGDLLSKAGATVGTFLGDISLLSMEATDEEIQQMGVEYAEYSEDIADVESAFGDIKFGGQKLGQAKIVKDDLSNVSKKEANDIKLEGLLSLMNDHVIKTDLKDTEGGLKQGRVVGTFSEILEQYNNIANTPEANLDNAQDVESYMNQMTALIDVVGRYLKLNVDYTQDIVEVDDNTMENSMLLNDDMARLKVKATDNNIITDAINEHKTKIDNVKELIKKSEYTRKANQFRMRCSHLDTMYDFLNHLSDKPTKSILKYIDNINKLLDKNKFKNLNGLLNAFSIEDEHKETRREELVKLLNNIEREILLAKESLSGQLDNEIENLKKEADIAFNVNDDFENESIVDYTSSNEMSGVLSGVNLRKERKEFKDKRSLNFYYYYTLTNLIRINEAGANGKYTTSDILKAYGRVVESRKDKGMKVANYEQDVLMVHAISFLISPDNTKFKYLNEDGSIREAHEGSYAKLVNKLLDARGYAGSGKSTIFVRDLIAVYKSLTQKDLKITIVTPNEALRDDHQKNIQKTYDVNEDSSIPNKNIQYLYYDELLDGGSISKESDFIIIDEGSLIGTDKFTGSDAEEIKNILEKRDISCIVLSDDSQVRDMNSKSQTLPIQEMGEKTIPLAEIFRTPLLILHQLQNHFRNKNKHTLSAIFDYPKGKYKIEKTDGLPIGLRYLTKDGVIKADERVIQEFVKAVTPDIKGNTLLDINRTILIVATTEDKVNLLKRYPELNNNYKDYIKTLQYDLNSVRENSAIRENAISGLKADNVFIAIDIENTEAGRNINTWGKAKVSRMGVTAVSRATRFVIMPGRENTVVSDADVIIEGWKSVGEREEVNTKTLENDRLLLEERLKTLVIDFKTTEDSDNSISDSDNSKDFDSNLKLSANGFKKTKTNTSKITKKLKNNKAKETDKHITDLDYIINLLPKDKKHKGSKERMKMYSLAIRYTIDPTTNLFDKLEIATKEYMQSVNQEYTDGFLKTVINSVILHPMIQEMDVNGLLIKSPTLTFNDYQANPMLLNTVGYTKVGNKVIPIVDIYEYNVSPFEVKTVSDYTKAKVGAYAAMLNMNGYIVNNVNVINVQETQTDFQYRNTQRITESDKIVYTNKAIEVIGTSESIIQLTKEQFFYTERNNPNAVNEVKENDNFIEKKTGKSYRVVEVTTQSTGGKLQNVVYIIDNASNSIIGNYNEADFKLKFEKEVFEEKPNMYNSSAIKYNKGEGGTISFVNIFPAGTEFKNEKDVFNINNTPLLELRQLVVNSLYSGYAVHKTFYNDFVAAKINSTGVLENPEHTFTNVIVNSIDDDTIKIILNDKNNLNIFKKHKITAIEEFKAKGLHNISFDGEPEIDFGVNLMDSKSEMFLDYLNGEKGITLDVLFKDAFIKEENDPFRDDLISLNKYRAEQIREGYIQAKNDSKNDFIFSDTFNIFEIGEGRKVRDGGNTLTLDELKQKGRENGFIVSDEISIVEHDGRTRFAVKVYRKDKANADVVFFDGKRITGTGDITEIINELSNASQIKKNIDKQLKAIDKLVDRSTKRIELAKSIFVDITRTKAFNFIMQNRNILDALSDQLDDYFYFNEGKLILKGGDLKLKMVNLKRGLEKVRQIYEHKKGKLVLHHTPFGEFKNEFIDKNLIGVLTDVSQREIYITTNKDIVSNTNPVPVSKKGNRTGRGTSFSRAELDKEYSPTDTTEFIEESEAINELISIVGERAVHSNTFFNKGLLKNSNGKQVYGQLHDAIMKFSVIDGKIEKYTPRHEAIHFIMKYMVKPDVSYRLLETAKRILRSKGKTEITDRDAHEYIADIFESGKYKANTLVGQFIQWIKSVAFWLNLNKGSVEGMLTFADRGGFRNAEVFSISDSIELDKKIDNEYTTVDAYRKMVDIFGNAFEVNFVRDSFITSDIIKYSPYGKIMKDTSSFISSVNDLILFAEDMADSIESEFGNKIHIKYYDDNNKLVSKDIQIEDMTANDYFLTRQNKQYESNRSASGAYIYYHLADRGTMSIMLQAALGNINLDKVLAATSDVDLHSNNATSIVKKDNEAVNPIEKRSQFLNMLLGIIPYWDFNTKKKVNRNGIRYISGSVLDNILTTSALKVRADGLPLTRQNWFNVLKEMMNQAPDSTIRNYIYSFLVEYGNISTDKIVVNELTNELSGVGLQSLVDNPDGWGLQINKIDDTIPKTILDDKLNGYKEILNAITTYYFSLQNNIQVKLVEGGKFDINKLEVLNNNNITSTKSKLIQNIEDGLYTRGIPDKTVRDAVGENKDKQIYEINEDGVFVVDNGKKTNIISRGKSKKDSYKIGLSDAVSLLRFMNLGDNVTVDVLKAINDNKLIGKNLYHMMLAIRVAQGMTKDINKNIEKDNETVVVYSKNTEKLAVILEDFYNAEGYILEGYDEQVQKTNKNSDVYNTVPLPSPSHFWKFINDELAPKIMYADSNIANLMIRKADGNMSYAHPYGNTLTDTFPPGTLSNPSSFVYADKVKKSVKDSDKNISPLYEKGIVGINYYNPILNKKIAFDSVNFFDAIQRLTDIKSFGDMTQGDFIEAIVESNRALLTSNRKYQKIATFSDMLADKTTAPMVQWFASDSTGKNKGFVNIKTYRDKINSISVDTNILTDIVSDFINYYARQKELSLNKWISITKKTSIDYNSKEGQKIIKDLRKNLDYVIEDIEGKKRIYPGRAITQEDNIYKDIQFGELSTEKKYKLIKDVSQDNFKAFVDVLVQSGYKVPNDILTLFSAFKIQSKGKSLGDVKSGMIKAISDVKKDGSLSYLEKKAKRGIITEKYNEDIKPYIEKIKEGEYIQGDNWHPYFEMLYWSHHVVNESISHLLRGSVNAYANVTDYIKRGSGLVAPGNIFDIDNNPDMMGESARVLVMNDIDIGNEQFGDQKIQATDGFSILNPVFHEFMRRCSGGMAGFIYKGALKTVNSYYDIENDAATYLKFAQFPVVRSKYKGGSKYYQSLLKTMLGEYIWNKFKDQINNDFDKAIMDMSDWLLTEEGKLYRKSMVDYIVYESAVKTGVTKTNQHTTTNSNVLSMDNAVFDTSLNNDDNIINVSNRTLRLQNLTIQDTYETNKTIPTQILSLLGNFNHNNELISEINNSLASLMDIGIDKLMSLEDNEQKALFIKQLGQTMAGEQNDAGKLSQIVFNNAIHPDTWMYKGVQVLARFVNKYVKPTMPGQSYVQAPEFMKLYWLKNESGEDLLPYTAEDLYPDEITDDSGEGYRNLKPMEFYYNGKKLSKDALLSLSDSEKSNIIMRPAEVVMPFTYMYKFGITSKSTLAGIMTISFKDGSRVNMMTPITTTHRNNDEVYNILKNKFHTSNYNEIIDSLHEDVANEIKKRMRGKDESTDMLLTVLSYYYAALNDSLDVMITRIPSTNGSSSSMGRVVAFSNDTGNTVYVSSEKNILDGSDYDIDQLSVYFRAIDEQGNIVDKEGEKEAYQNTIFNAIDKFYKDGKNLGMILANIDMQKMRDTAKENKIETPHSDLGGLLKAHKINMSGNKLVGHFANQQNFTSKLMHISNNERKKLFNKTLKLLHDDTYLANTIDFVANLINASTDNAKEGGILGRNNITQSSSPLIAGMTLMAVEKGGDIETIVYELLKRDYVIAAIEESYFSSAIGEFKSNIWDTLENQKIDKDEAIIDEIDKIKQYAYAGEQLKRFGDIVKLQQGIPSNTYELYKIKENIEESMGMPLDYFLDNINIDDIELGKYDVERQLKWVSDGYRKYSKADSKWKNNETNIRDTFNIARVVSKSPILKSYLRMLNEVINTLNTVYTVEQYKDIKTDILDDIRKGRFITEDHYKAYDAGINKLVIGQFISDTFNDVQLQFIKDGKIVNESFDLSDVDKRTYFTLRFPDYVRQLKKEYKDNRFISRLKAASRKTDGYEYIEFSNSNYLTSNDKSGYFEEFKKLPENIKKAFRAYQMVAFGFVYSNGSFIDVIDDWNEVEYSSWIKGFNNKGLDKSKEVAPEEIIVKETSFLGTSKKAKYKTIGKNSKLNTIVVKKENEDTQHVVSSPYPAFMNSYCGYKTIKDGHKVRSVSLEEMDELNDTGSVIIRNTGWNGIHKQSITTFENDPDLLQLYEGNVAFIPDGTAVVIESDGTTNIKATKPIKKAKKRKSVIKGINSIKANNVISVLMDKMKTVFPNIQIEYMRGGDDIAYIQNGIVYLNLDLIQTDTPIHELTHIFIDILEVSNLELYNKLKMQAVSLIEENGELIQKIARNYKNVSHKDFIKEVIANIAGWNSQEKIESFIKSYGIKNAESKSITLWNKLKSAIGDFYKWIKALVYGSFGLKDINTLGDFNTIEELSNLLTDALINNKTIGYVSSKTIGRLTDSTIRKSKIKLDDNSITDAGNLINFLENVPIDKQSVEYQTMVDIANIKEIIKKNGMKLPAWKTGEEIKFIDLDSKETEERLKAILLESKEHEESTVNNLIKWLNNGAHEDNSVKFFGKNKNGEAIYDPSILNQIKRSMDYSNRTVFMRYSDMINDPKLSMYYNEKLKGYNPIIAVEYKSEGDNYIEVSIYNITSKNLNETNIFAEKGNILSNLINDKETRAREITLKNTTKDIRKLLVALMSNYMMSVNDNIYVRDSGVIQFRPNALSLEFNDSVAINRTIKAMGEVDSFNDMLSPSDDVVGIKTIFDGKHLKETKQEYEKILISIWGDPEAEVFKNGVKEYRDNYRTLSSSKKIEVLGARLRFLVEKNKQSELTISETKEMFLITRTMDDLKNVGIIEGQKNDYSDMTKLSTFFSTGGDVSGEILQEARALTLTSSQKVVELFYNKKKTLWDTFDFFSKRYNSKHIGEKLGKDVAGKMFDEIMVKVKDADGIERNAGWIYWTNDVNEDTMFGEQAKKFGIKKEVLQEGKKFVDIITDMMVKLVHHNHIMNYGLHTFVSGSIEKYTYDMAKKDLFEKSSYRPGMLPVMTKTTVELLASGKLKAAWKKKKLQVTDEFILFEESVDMTVEDKKLMSRLNDQFFYQIGYNQKHNNTVLGNKKRMSNVLGLRQDIDKDGNSVWVAVDKVKNDNVSKDMESIMNYFVLSTLRNIEYEENVLPVINGLKIYLQDLEVNKSIATKHQLEYLDIFTRQGIEGKREKLTGDIMGVRVDNAAMLLKSITSPLVMAGNINIGVIGATANGMFSFIEAVGNTIAKDGYYSVKNMVKASEIFFHNYKKVSQLMIQHQVMNMTEYDLLHNRTKQRTKKYLLSSHHANWTNWAADMYARGVIMVAQMLQDGSWDAYTFNEKTKEIDYNVKKDKRYYNADGKQTDEQKGLEANMKRMLIQNGVSGQTEDGKLVRGYDFDSARVFKFLADKYVVGSYDNLSRTLLDNFLIGRMFMQFSNWFMSRWTNAFRKGDWIKEGGRYVMVKDNNGKLIPMWERAFVEGYMTTIAKMVVNTFRKGNLSEFKNMDGYQKKNLAKGITSISLYLLMIFLYGALVDDEDDKNKPIPDWRLIRNFKYAAASLLVLPAMFELVKNPFASLGIVDRGITNRYGRWNVKNLENFIPFRAGFEAFDFMYEE